jgi:hypothetical protein
MPHRTIGVVVVALSLWARIAGACPDCVSARLVQATVFDHRFWGNLVLISAPLLMLSVMCAWLYRLGIEPTETGRPEHE